MRARDPYWPWLVVLFAAVAGLTVMACKSCEAAFAVEPVLTRLAHSGDPLKERLAREALAHLSGVETFRAHTLYYHPLEAGSNWRKWSRTATGTLVRPGVASCTAANRREWLGAWIWFRGHGLCKVEDVFPESGDRRTFDLAVWAQPGQSYSDWINDWTRVRIAETRNVYTQAIMVKPRGGWER